MILVLPISSVCFCRNFPDQITLTVSAWPTHLLIETSMMARWGWPGRQV